MPYKLARLILEDGNVFQGFSFGFPASSAGEVVFNTGMTGYPETLTDPSYFGEILTLTYPLAGNYGAPNSAHPDFPNPDFESDRIQVRGLIVADYSESFSHWHSRQSLADWLIAQKIPAITGIDTRALTQFLRNKGTMLGKIVIDDDPDFYDPNRHNLVSEVSRKKIEILGNGSKRIALIDCGAKRSIISNLIKRGFEVLALPWNADISAYDFNGILISNGPGDPTMCAETIRSAKFAFDHNIPTFGICLGHQILALAAGAKTFKLKFGHRGQNQPVIDHLTGRCYITSQNHGYAVEKDTLPHDWQAWFSNLNDHTNEGMIHHSGRFLSVQFHPEAVPGPVDTQFLFDRFLELVK
ncbi:MAG: glutamine-hydrolyzing carbamoyl-phosphate synthase small subunit [Candidatus Marinimicrobia bacterium]|nr:glutamine-hydrolyzing carbamoyl-phosphate synthase small subunit [Candidatus Neomarinimicrobiota bacterium]